MPRNQNPGNVALRNRNRVTNKTRLKVIKGNIDADPIVLDEDEERARVVSTAGVDAEDANEHHLQAVLSAASHRATTLGQRATRAASEKVVKHHETPTAYIPVPDAAGVVEGYSELYPCGKWTEPSTYLKTSNTVDDCITHALADGFTYFMDERDKEWLDKNNQESRGEGTSAQATATAGTTTRSGASHRSSKAKGKEPETSSPIPMSEDQFELVIGIFEKATHDNTPFLHVSLQQGMSFPPFSNYNDIFASDLPPSTFATLVVPSNIPRPPLLSRMARVVYPYWRDRRMEREGHRIIPALNYDESDTQNESYICFRRREIKAVRKTRATQATSSDKLLRLKGELSTSLELAQFVLSRENQKREAANEAQRVWEKRVNFVDLKRKFSVLSSKEDDELLIDKERKRPTPNESLASHVLKLKNRPSLDALSSTTTEPHLRPRDRTNMINNMVEDHLKRQKERDLHWDDQIDNPYQSDPIPYTERLFKAIIPTAGSYPSFPPAFPEQPFRASRPIRLRVGRGGRMHLDRRLHTAPLRRHVDDYLRHEPRFPQMVEGLDKSETEERAWRVYDRWKFDSDITSATPESAIDEEDRILEDDFKPRIIRNTIDLLKESDHACLTTDPRLFLPDGHNGVNVVLPFRISPSMQPTPRRESQSLQRTPQMAGIAIQPPAQHDAASTSHQPASFSNGTPVSMQAPVRKMAPPISTQHARAPPVSSNGAPRLPATPSMSGMQPLVGAPNLPSATANSPSGGGSASSNGGINGAINGNVHKVSPNVQPNGIAIPTGNAQVHLNNLPGMHDATTQALVSTPARPKSQNQLQSTSQQASIPNGYPPGMANGAFSGFSNGVPNGYANHVATTTPAGQHHGLSVQQAQNLKVAFAGVPSSQGIPMQPSLPASASVPPRPPSAYAQHLSNVANGGNGSNFGMIGPVNMNLKLPTTRQIQWAATVQRPQSVPNGADAAHSPNIPHASPGAMIRAPSANGHQLSPPMHGGPSPTNHILGQGPGRTSPANPHLAHSLPSHNGSPHSSHMHPSPTRPMQSSVPSPLLQHQQVVGGHNQGQRY